jgi:hypothetical protein
MDTALLMPTLLVQILTLIVAILSVLQSKGEGLEHQQRKDSENEDSE